MKFLLLNIGNTHTQWVFVDSSVWDPQDVSELATADWQADLRRLPEVPEGCQVWASSVVPYAKNLLASSGKYSSLHWIDAVAGAAAGLDFSLVDTSTLGADRIANAAALLQGELPAGNFDCGTAVTLEVVLENGVFAGGAILPGRKLMRSALNHGTAALPELPLDYPLPAKFGCNTLQALSLGIDGGIVGMVRELITRARKQGINNFVASGGDAAYFCRALPELAAAGNEFTLYGIYCIARAAADKSPKKSEN